MKDQWSAQKKSKWDNIDLLLKIQEKKIYITTPILIIFCKSRAHFSFIFIPLQYQGLLKEWIISWGLHLAVVGFDMRTPSVFVCTHIFSTLLCMRKRVWTFVVGQSTFHHYYDVNLPATFLYYPSWEGPLPFCFLLPFHHLQVLHNAAFAHFTADYSHYCGVVGLVDWPCEEEYLPSCKLASFKSLLGTISFDFQWPFLVVLQHLKERKNILSMWNFWCSVMPKIHPTQRGLGNVSG